MLQLFQQLVIDRQQVEDIGSGIVQLLVGERTGQPVGSGLILVEGDLQQSLGHGIETNRQARASKGRRQLRIVRMCGHGTGFMMDQLQIFTGSMQYRDAPWLLQNLPQTGEIIDGHRIDQRQAFTVI